MKKRNYPNITGTGCNKNIETPAASLSNTKGASGYCAGCIVFKY